MNRLVSETFTTKKIKAILLFYRKLFIPSLALAILAGLYSMFMNNKFTVGSFGLAYLLIPSLMHFFIYEVKNRNEYYFYFNLGLSRSALWISTAVLNFAGSILISIVAWIVYRLIVS